MSSNRFEAERRAAKVAELVATARARKITAPRLLSDPGVIRMLEADLQMRMPTSRPPSVETWRLVYAALEALDRLDVSDTPLVGECGCGQGRCCLSCCRFPACAGCGTAVAS